MISEELSNIDKQSVIFCQICTEIEKQYKCPKCAMLTCSLRCCKEHKEQFFCDGRRDRTAFVVSSQLKENHLRSDFHFLEDVLQTKDSAKRTLTDKCGGKESNYTKRKQSDAVPGIFTKSTHQNLSAYSKGVKNLVEAVRERGTTLILMPPGMSKRINNKTFLSNQTKILSWKVHLVFVLGADFDKSTLLRPDVDSSSAASLSEQQLNIISDALVSTSLDCVSEQVKLSELLADFLDPRPGNSIQRHTLKGLRVHRDELECVLQRIPSPANNPLFCKVSLDCTLREALANQTVLEYPTLFFGWAQHLQQLRSLVTEADNIVEASEINDTSASGVGNGKRSRKNNSSNRPNKIAKHSMTAEAVQSPQNKIAPTLCGTSPVERVSIAAAASTTHLTGGGGAGLLSLVDYGSDDEDGAAAADREDGEVVEERISARDTSELSHASLLSSSADPEQREEQVEDGEEEDVESEGEDEEAFLSALQEMEGQDIATLQAIISAEEHSLLGAR